MHASPSTQFARGVLQSVLWHATRKMKIAHISDLHIGLSPGHDQQVARKVALLAESGIDHLIITGDLTQSGQQSEYQTMVDILNRHGFQAADRLTVIPGNHDLFRFFFRDFQYLHDFRKKLHRVPKTAMDIYNYDWKRYENDLTLFNSYFGPALQGTLYNTDCHTCGYPYIKLVGERIALIALESNHILPQIKRNSVCSNGYVDPEKTRRILAHKVLKDKIKVVLMHHHLVPETEVRRRDGKWLAATIKLVNREEIIEILTRNRIDLILHGHYHHHEQYLLDDRSLSVVNNGDNRGWSVITCIDGGITLQSKSEPNPGPNDESQRFLGTS
jgi:3',5'-cyclic AMP phosphodiesterase CpdA